MSEAQRLPLGALLDEIASEYRGGEIEIFIHLPQTGKSGPEPKIWRIPEILHGLGNIIANAADFARTPRLHPRRMEHVGIAAFGGG